MSAFSCHPGIHLLGMLERETQYYIKFGVEINLTINELRKDNQPSHYEDFEENDHLNLWSLVMPLSHCCEFCLQTEAYSYCVVLHRWLLYQFVSVPIVSYLIIVHSHRFVVHSNWDSPPVCGDSVRCNTMRNDRTVVLDRIGSCKFLLVPIVFSLHRSAIVLIRHHHRTASHCIVPPSCCISLHRINLCLIRVWFALIRK